MMTHDEMIAVIQAHKEGKTIQYRCGDEWGVARSPTWDFKSTEYRVKPEPSVYWFNFYSGDGVTMHRKQSDAKNSVLCGAIRVAVNMVEADEDD